MIMISEFLFNFINICAIVSFFAKLLTLGILFSTTVKAVVVAKLEISGILSPNLFYLSIMFIYFNNVIFYYIT